METSDVNVRYWALYSHVYFYFESGGSLKLALKKWKASEIVIYFYRFYCKKSENA
jgi:hypothetical protein